MSKTNRWTTPLHGTAAFTPEQVQFRREWGLDPKPQAPSHASYAEGLSFRPRPNRDGPLQTPVAIFATMTEMPACSTGRIELPAMAVFADGP
jgi:hypothetical protein